MPRESTLRALRELEQLGLVAKTGELRKGQPVWRITAGSKDLEETAPELLEAILHRGLAES